MLSVWVITSCRLKISSVSSHTRRIGIAVGQFLQFICSGHSKASILHLICIDCMLHPNIENLETLLFLHRRCTICQWNWLWLICFLYWKLNFSWPSAVEKTNRIGNGNGFTMKMHIQRIFEKFNASNAMAMSKQATQSNITRLQYFVAHLYLFFSSISCAFDFYIVQNSTVRWFHWPSLNCLSFIVKHGRWLYRMRCSIGYKQFHKLEHTG